MGKHAVKALARAKGKAPPAATRASARSAQRKTKAGRVSKARFWLRIAAARGLAGARRHAGLRPSLSGGCCTRVERCGAARPLRRVTGPVARAARALRCVVSGRRARNEAPDL